MQPLQPYYPKDSFTKAYKYLYLPAFYILHPAREVAFLNNIRDQYFNVYIGDQKAKDFNVNDGILYIRLNHTHPDFLAYINFITEYNVFYIDNYVLDEKTTMVRYKYPSQEAYKEFLVGNYSKMFKPSLDAKGRDLNFILEKDYCKNLYSEKDDKDKPTGKIDIAWHVLMHTEEGARFIADAIGLDEKQLEVVRSKEYDFVEHPIY